MTQSTGADSRSCPREGCRSAATLPRSTRCGSHRPKPDARLGQVPIAAIEMLPGVSPPAPGASRDLRARASDRIT